MSVSTSRPTRWLPVIVWAIVSAWLIAVAIRGEFNGVISDAYIYLLMADAFNIWPHSAHPIPLDFLFEHYAFPPLFPLLLAIGRAGIGDPHWTFALNACVLGAAITLLMRVYQGFGLSKYCAAALAMTVGILPITWLTAMDVQSEPLYLLLSIGCLAMLAARSLSARAWLIAGLSCGLAVVTRSIGISLLAVFLFLWWRNGRRVGAMPIVLALAPLIAWTAFRALSGYNASYTNSKHRLLRGSVAQVWNAIETNLQALKSHAIQSFNFTGPEYVEITLGGLACFALVEFLRRLIRAEPDALYVACYVTLILCWPYPDHARRFLFMILPLLMGYAVNSINTITRGYVALPIANLAAPTAIVIFVLLSLPTTIQMLRSRVASESPELAEIVQSPGSYLIQSPESALVAARYSTRVFDLARRGRDFVPRDGCVSSTLPDHVMYYAHRPAIDLKLSVGDRALRAQQLARCPYVFMVGMKSYPPDRTAPLYPFTVVRSQLEVLEAARAEPENSESQVVAIWARYSAPKIP